MILEQDHPIKDKFNQKQKLAVILLDAVILAELTFCIYWASRFGDDLTKMFLISYLPTALLTLIFGKMAINRLKGRSEEDNVLD